MNTVKITTIRVIPIFVAIATVLFIFLFPVLKGGSTGDINSFRTSFGWLAAISYAIYLCVFFVLAGLIKHFQLKQWWGYVAHVIAITAGYSLLVWTYYAIASGTLQL